MPTENSLQDICVAGTDLTWIASQLHACIYCKAMSSYSAMAKPLKNYKARRTALDRCN